MKAAKKFGQRYSATLREPGDSFVIQCEEKTEDHPSKKMMSRGGEG